MISSKGPWVVVLAGGEGSRLKQWAREHLDCSAPKPFCRFRGNRTLLAGTLERARRLTSAARILVVVNEAHRPWWSEALAGIPERNVLAQSLSRGTAVALLHALVRILVDDPEPRLVMMPCDHDLEDEAPFLDAIRTALAELDRSPEHPLLLGAQPQAPDSDYGWIVAAREREGGSRQALSLIEKPSPAAASQLMERGALWNMLVLAATGRGLLQLFENAQPTLVDLYLQAMGWSEGAANAAERIYQQLPERDLVGSVLQPQAHRLRVIEVPACGWMDLGTPERASAWMASHAEAPVATPEPPLEIRTRIEPFVA